MKMNKNVVISHGQWVYTITFPMFMLLCIFLSRHWVRQWETPGHTLSWCITNHTVLLRPCTLCCEGFHPSRNVLPIMRVRGQSAATPGGRDLLGTLSHWLCPYIYIQPQDIFFKEHLLTSSWLLISFVPCYLSLGSWGGGAKKKKTAYGLPQCKWWSFSYSYSNTLGVKLRPRFDMHHKSLILSPAIIAKIDK